MACLLEWYEAQRDVREATGHNDGRQVEAYQRVTGNYHTEWCGSYQAAGHQHCGMPFPAGAGLAANWYLPGSPRTFYIQGVRGSVDDLQPGHNAGIWSPSKHRVGHTTGVVARTRNGFITSEGNTGSRATAGVHRLSRSKGEIYAGSDWTH
ncbi:hypothetical protein [Hymenobacter rubidus]|uniref:hypothetical protein n=1 Tax=Hymenobacter rubidus TaxID=1441626 RepID=UPI00191E360F|nr:hypothetical protein [Hymenobacter rubidus]